jgi:hypothetical protein
MLLNSQMGTELSSLRGVRSFLFFSVQKRATSAESSQLRLKGSLLRLLLEGLNDLAVEYDIAGLSVFDEQLVKVFDWDVLEDEADGHLPTNRRDFLAD